MMLESKTYRNAIGDVSVTVTTHRLVYADRTPVTVEEVRQLDRVGPCDDAPSGYVEWAPICRVRTGLTAETYVPCREDDDGAEWWGETDWKGKRIYRRLEAVSPYREWLAVDLYTGYLFVAVLPTEDDREEVEWSASDEDYDVLKQYYPITEFPPTSWDHLPLAVLPSA